MDIRESIKIAVTTLIANKMRSGLTMLGVAIGNAAVIALVGVGQGAQNYTLDKLESYGANQLQVYSGSSDEDNGGDTIEPEQLVLSDAEAIATQAPAVKAVAPQINSSMQLSAKSRTANISLQGTTPEILYVTNSSVAKGRFFNRSEQQQSAQVIVLGPALAQKLFGSESPLGKDVEVSQKTFQVVGIAKAKGSSLVGGNPDETAYIPITTMADRLIGTRLVRGIPIDSLQVSAQNKQSIRSAAFQITNILTRLHGKKDITVSSDKSFEDLIGNIAGMLSLLLASIASISLLVGGIGIMNMMLVSITERTQEIGLRKAVGATNQAILTQFLLEAIILSITGGVVGLATASGGMLLIGIFSPLKPGISVAAVALAIGVSGSIGLIFGVVPARRAAQLDPIVALRSA
jgi:putative ABC transport system permease protein